MRHGYRHTGYAAMLLTLAGAPAAHAQSQAGASSTSSPPGSKPALQEIVVTARRVSENLQKVPISVGTLNAEALNTRQILNINDLKGQIVGLATVPTTAPGFGIFTIRGISNTSLPTPAADNGIGLYIDGVYIARGQGSGTDIPDLARVEVLRGPQGTLFGRNSSAGAVNFITNTPTDKREIDANLLYGNYHHLRGTLMVNTPLLKDLDLRVVYLHDEIRGDVRNLYTGQGADYAGYGSFRPARYLGSSNTDAVTAKLRYTGIKDLTVDYKYDYTHDDAVQSANQIIGYAPGFLAQLVAGLGPQPQVLTGFNRIPYSYQDDVGPIHIRTSGHLATLAYIASDQLTLKNISSWRSTYVSDFADNDGGAFVVPGTTIPFCVSCSYTVLPQHQFSQEDQAVGKFGRLNAIVGVYYFIENAKYISVYPNFQIVTRSPGVYNAPTDEFVPTLFGFPYPGPYALGEDGRYRNRAYAGYGHFDFQFDDRLKLVAGGRYTVDKRQTYDMRSFAALPQSSVTYHRFTYDAALDYNFTRDQMVYAKYATGYVSGGVAIGIPFRPEDTKQVEIGAKTEFWDHRARLNGAVYYTWIKNRQTAFVNTNPIDSPTLAAAGFSAPYPVGIFVYNISGTSTVKGLELEGSLAPTRGLTLNANFSYNDPHDNDGERSEAPKTNIALSGQYDGREFHNGSHLSLTLDADYRSKYFGAGATLASEFVGDVPASLRPGYATSAGYLSALENAVHTGGYWLANARLALVGIPVSTGRVTLAGFVRNIFDNQNLLSAQLLGVTYNGAFERPRTYGVELNARF